MTRSALRTVLVGLGRVGAGYADDPVMARWIPYATHAQVLSDHPAFDWGAVVDLSEEARARAAARWGVPRAAATVDRIAAEYGPEVAVLATPPGPRMAIVEGLPGLRAVVVEKPLGRNVAEAEEFLALCEERSILVQVNLWRRADQQFRGLAGGGLRAEIGEVQAAFALYGNGLMNNGTHLVDFVRMLVGEFEVVQALPGPARSLTGVLEGDVDVPFSARLAGGIPASFLPLDFSSYREVGLDVWGKAGRLAVLQEGLSISSYPRVENRSAAGEFEIASDQPRRLDSTVGDAFYRLYTNLAEAIAEDRELWSPGPTALRSEQVIQAVLESVKAAGAPVVCRPDR